MKYAVIAIGGSQQQVEENQIITVPNLNLEPKATGTCKEVLLTVNDKDVQIGTPTIDGSQVDYEVVENYRGKKLDVFKYKSKSRYRKSKGHRDYLTDIKITKILFK